LIQSEKESFNRRVIRHYDGSDMEAVEQVAQTRNVVEVEVGETKEIEPVTAKNQIPVSLHGRP
jgi:hypothetical protein